ncbi:MAG: cell division protein FtsK [Candidatus Cloacimonetes bacterium]|nr:cell division protein FtsK [Candidatus Cloacimonadota bacterium]
MKQKVNKEPVIFRIVLSIIIFLLSILFLISVTVNLRVIVEDYQMLLDAKLNFFKIIQLNFPNLQNPVGPFGAFFGYWLTYIFGKFFSISLLVGMALLSFLNIFLHKEKHLILKAVSFIVFSFFFNFIFFIVNQASQNYAGIIPWNSFQFLMKIFDSTGTMIISIVMVITCILIIFEVQNVIRFFSLIFNATQNLIMIIFRKKSKSPQKSKTKREKKKKDKQLLLLEETDDTKKKKRKKLNIVDHASPKNKIVQNTKVKPKITPRKLSQNPEDMPDEPLRKFEKPDIETFLTSFKPSLKDREEIEANIKIVSKVLEEKLAEFGVEAEVINVNIGPIITQYEIKPASGIKVSRFHALADDLSLAIKATSIRVQAPIPGRGLVGIEIPNITRDTIFLKDVLLSDTMKALKSPLGIGLGKDIAGNPIVADLTKMPHLLIAGATGSGKSVCINTIICSMLLQAEPENVRLILVDPKRIELSGYEGIPHLVQPVVTDNEEALAALNWSVSEMERRYELLQQYKVRNIGSFNEKIKKLKAEDPEFEETELPFIVLIIDEFADLIMTIGRDIEMPIARLAQMARAIGIHLIIATQRPSSKVITGIIKANFPARIAFQVASKIDSRVILDANGAERLLGRGDSFFLPPGVAIHKRIHGAFLTDDEIANIIEYLKTQPKPKTEIKVELDEDEGGMMNFAFDDELFPEAAVAIVSAGSASVSMLQRHFKVGYARAGRLIDMLEQAGIVGQHVGSKPREVLATEEDLKIYGYLKD